MKKTSFSLNFLHLLAGYIIFDNAGIRPRRNPAKFVYKRSFTAVTRSGQRAVVIVVANVATTVVDIATVVVHVATRPRKYTMRYIFYKERQVALIETISKLEYIYFTEHFTGREYY